MKTFELVLVYEIKILLARPTNFPKEDRWSSIDGFGSITIWRILLHFSIWKLYCIIVLPYLNDC